jgi:hypothetical protein
MGVREKTFVFFYFPPLEWQYAADTDIYIDQGEGLGDRDNACAAWCVYTSFFVSGVLMFMFLMMSCYTWH